jgi:hypothetical protein
MKRTYVLAALTTALALALVLTGCPSAGSGGGGGGDTPVSVDSVAPATPGGTAGTGSFAGGAGFSSADLPADKTEAFLAAAQGIASVSGFIGEFLSEKAGENWPPSGTLEITPDPENFDTATEISISAGFGDPTRVGIVLDSSDDPGGLDALAFYGEGAVAGSAEITASREASSHGLDYPKRVTFTAETSAEFLSGDTNDDETVDPVVPHGENTPLPTVPASEVYVALNWNLDAKPACRSTIDGPELSGVEAAYAISAGLSAALTVVDAHIDDTDDDGEITGADDPVSGNFLVDFTFNDEEKLNISDSMTEAELETYLQNKLAGDFTLTIDVYDDSGALDTPDSYSYSIADIVNILQSVQ